MYRILKADKDGYVTNKLIFARGSSLTSSIDANVGQAGTIDIYKLYNETPVPSGTSGIEVSRGLIHFDLDPLRAITSSVLNPLDPSFKCLVSMRNVYGGQPVPSNYTLSLYPLAKDWAEGRGTDVIGYRDLDAVNWLTASFDTVAIPVVNPEMAEYQEAVVEVPTLTNTVSIPFVTPFTGVPIAVITDISSSLGVVNAFIGNTTTASTLVVKFSSPFSGSFVYRAVEDITPGLIKTVVRLPRYPGVFANVVVGSVPIVVDNRFSVSYSDFGGNPTDTYASLYETSPDNLTNVYTTITSSSTLLIAGTFSAVISAQVNVLGYRSLDQFYGTNSWTSGGVAAVGVGGDVSGLLADYYTSFLSPTGYVPLEFKQSFARGDEDLLIDVTPVVRLVLSGDLPDYGFRLSFTGSQETDSVTRFVKRFSTRQSRNTNLHPTLIVKYNDTFIDNQTSAFFDYPNKIGTYFTPFGSPTNFTNANGSPVVGSGSLLLELKAQQSQYVTATTYSFSHQATINYTSASWVYFSASFTGSQIAIGGLNQSGSYYADVYLPSNITGLSGVLNASGEATFTTVWKSLDNATIFSTGPSITFRPLASKNNVGSARNYATNIINLKDVYIDSDVARLRVFVLDYDPTLTSFYLPYKGSSKIFKESYWRVIDPYTKETLIPFDTTDKGTAMSADGEGMYFDLYMSDLPVNRPLEIELLFKEFGSNYLVENQGFLFKVVKS